MVVTFDTVIYLTQVLDGDSVLTVFAPSEAAFSRFPSRVTKRLLNNRQQLIRVLKYHIISGELFCLNCEMLKTFLGFHPLAFNSMCTSVSGDYLVCLLLS